MYWTSYLSNEWMNEGLKAHQHIRLFSAINCCFFFVKWLFAIVEEQWQSMWKKKKRKRKSRAFISKDDQGIF